MRIQFSSPSCLIRLLLLLLILLLLSICSGYSSDLEVLLKIKTSLTARSDSVLEDWKPSSKTNVYCSFSGVTCDKNARVISLNVSFLSLNGSIPPEIGLLNKLVNLTLSGNNLSGQVPIEMAELTSLVVLNLSNNLLGGDFPGQITLGMAQLQVLDVYNNNFTGPLPTELVGLKYLRQLHLGGNYFTGGIPESYSEIQSLEFMGLNGNALSGRVPASLSKLNNLKELYLGYYSNYEGGIPPEFGSFSSLQLLDMGQCNLTGEIPSSLGQLTHLHSLFLQINNLTGSIPPGLSNLLSLKSLDLSINNLSGDIPEGFSRMKNLTLLNLFTNKLRGPMPDFVGDLPNLEVLQVWGNNFTLELPPSLGRNCKLKLLDVSFNHLTGEVPRDLCLGGKLQTLILMNNFFVGGLPEELGQCNSLTKIRVMSNQLSGNIPSGIFNLPLLTIIELNDNHFSGDLPSKMAGDALGIFSISNNMFTGTIPPAIGSFRNLQTLSLDTNSLTGDIPQEIFLLKHLTKLNVSANNLTGDIPPTISQCVSLNSIDLSRNSLTGEIPEGITQLKDLGTINISRNQISGQIPGDMRYMRSLTTLDLSFNNLIGTIPAGGQLSVFNDTCFAGNPNLCDPRAGNNITCLPSHNWAQGGGRMASIASTKLIITVIAVVTVLMFVIVTVYRMRKKRVAKSRVWRLTAFQRLVFKAEDVLECLKEENIIGKGGAGIVYRGSMPDGSADLAIKMLVGRGRSDHGFSAEIQTLGRIRHRNIVRLLGYVSNKDTNLLLYEYIPNGSLGEVLHGSKGGHLVWETRYRIAVEAAKGLCYLHHDCSPLIIHRDVKSNNILLDSYFGAHVADFGLAKFLQDDGASQCMSSIAGSYGYIAPEYAYTLKVDEKSDVYSFGVVLLELVTGRKPVGEFGDGVDIVRWVRKTTSELSQPSDAATVMAIVDPRLSGYPLTSVIHMFKIAMLCVEDEGPSRPNMRDVVHMLTNPPQPVNR